MSLVWKLLRQHISLPQFAGFLFANLFGMTIVLLGVQLYNDILPVFTAEDSFMKSDYVVVSKQVGQGGSMTGGSSSFSTTEVEDLESKPFIEKVGNFVGNDFKVTAAMGVSGTNVLNSEIFLQSIPDNFVSVDSTQWRYVEGSTTVPVILPRTYINIYNFGLARSRSLPKISDGLAGMIDLNLHITGEGKQMDVRGRVIGFSTRMSEILVPRSFMTWANSEYAHATENLPVRLIVQMRATADEQATTYMQEKGYEIEDNQQNARKATGFLRLIVSIVLIVGLVISILSFYILMLSIFLLVQKNKTKLQNLLLIGYSPSQVARPYQMLTLGLNAIVLVLSLVLVSVARHYYMDIVYTLMPEIQESTMLPALACGMVLFCIVTIVNSVAIRQSISPSM